MPLGPFSASQPHFILLSFIVLSGPPPVVSSLVCEIIFSSVVLFFLFLILLFDFSISLMLFSFLFSSPEQVEDWGIKKRGRERRSNEEFIVGGFLIIERLTD